MTGTPKTLREAITNGFHERVIDASFYTGIPMVEAHVTDFINQKLTVLMMSDNDADVKAAQRMQELLGLVVRDQEVSLVKVIEVDQWSSTGCKGLMFDAAVLASMQSPDAEVARDIGIAKLDRKVVLETANPEIGKVWFRRGMAGEMELWKSNYDTSD